MGIWSIEPSGASIDSSSGKATFPPNSTVEQYTITYDEGNGCKVTYIYNIPSCDKPPTPPIECICLVDNCAKDDDLHEIEVNSNSDTGCDTAWAEHPENYTIDTIEYATSSEGPWIENEHGWLSANVETAVSCHSGKSNKQAGYSWSANDTDADRWARVHWTWEPNTKEDGMCDDSWAYIKQLARQTPTATTCDVKLTISGLEGDDKATVTWGSEKTEQLGNGEYTHTTTTSSIIVNISADGYMFSPSSFNFTCGGTTAGTATAIASECSCNNSNITVNGKSDVNPNAGDRWVANISANCTDNMTIIYKSGDEIIDTSATPRMGQSHSLFTTISGNDSTTNTRTGTYSIAINGEDCGKYFEITQKKKETTCETCEDINIRIDRGEITIPKSGGDNIYVGVFQSDCPITKEKVTISFEHYEEGPEIIDTTKPVTYNPSGQFGQVSASTYSNPTSDKREEWVKILTNGEYCGNKLKVVQDGDEKITLSKEVTVSIQITNEYINTFDVLGQIIESTSDGDVVRSSYDIGFYTKQCSDKEESDSSSKTVTAETETDFSNFRLEFSIRQCHGWKISDCANDEGPFEYHYSSEIGDVWHPVEYHYSVPLDQLTSDSYTLGIIARAKSRTLLLDND